MESLTKTSKQLNDKQVQKTFSVFVRIRCSSATARRHYAFHVESSTGIPRFPKVVNPSSLANSQTAGGSGQGQSPRKIFIGSIGSGQAETGFKKLSFLYPCLRIMPNPLFIQSKT